MPLNEHGKIEVRASKGNYDIDKAVKKWIEQVPPTKWGHLCSTKGGWEDWMQAELEMTIKDLFDLKTTIREDIKPYSSNLAADFSLPPTPQLNGMIVELKCENAFSQSGSQLQKPVVGDIDKRLKVRPEYKDYAFVVLAMAYTNEGKLAVQDSKLGLRPINRASAKLNTSGTMQAFKKQYSSTPLDPAFLEMVGALTVTEPEGRPGLRPRPDPTESGGARSPKAHKTNHRFARPARTSLASKP